MNSPFILFCLISSLFLCGCETQRRQVAAFYEEQVTPSYMPTNFTQKEVPTDIVQVVVLPISEDHLEEAQLAEFDRILTTELAKTTCFSLISLSRDRLEGTFGSRTVTLQTPTPPHFFEQLQAQTGADAILVNEIVTYRPYAPIAIGLRLTLISLKTGEILWAFDDTFDSGLTTVALGAQRYSSVALRTSYPFDEKHTILISPRLFFQYAAYEAFKTIRKPSLICKKTPV